MMNLGYYPMLAGPENLVWDNRTKTLYAMPISQFLICLLTCVSQLLDWIS